MNALNLITLEQVTLGRSRWQVPGAPMISGCRQPICQIATDSRHVLEGDVFWALSGQHHDGARFAAEAFRRGAAGVVTHAHGMPVPEDRWILEVDDSLQALHRLAGWKRHQFTGTVVAITGSVAKSTTREMLNAILRQGHVGTASPRSFNNEVGLPLSMLELDQGRQYALFELGASHLGEIDRLAELCRPHIGVITAAGDAHLGSFGGYEAIARAKCELLGRLEAGGAAILNSDCPRLRRAAADWKGRTLWFGRGYDADVMATHVDYSDGRLSFRVGSDRYELPVWGRHHLVPALAALSAARTFGATTNEIVHGLASFEPLPHRSQVRQLGSVTVIDDTYNASPAAMKAALGLLRETTASGRKIAVVGDMLELGASSASLHRLLGEMIVEHSGADMLIACGSQSRCVADGARQAGMRAGDVHACQTVEAAWQTLRTLIGAGDVILFKASRAIGLDRLVAALETELQSKKEMRPSSHRTFGTPSLALSLRELGAAHPPG